MAKLVSQVYGDALFELAKEENRTDEFWEEAQALREILQENIRLVQMMVHPEIIKEEKIQMLTTVFGDRISDEMLELMRMVVEKNHFAQMEQILAYFTERVMEDKNIGLATVITPMELTEAQKRQVEKRLLETTQYVSFRMKYEVDADLIGGMVIRIGDRVVDSSIRTKIYNLSRELSKIQLKAGECAP